MGQLFEVTAGNRQWPQATTQWKALRVGFVVWGLGPIFPLKELYRGHSCKAFSFSLKRNTHRQWTVMGSEGWTRSLLCYTRVGSFCRTIVGPCSQSQMRTTQTCTLLPWLTLLLIPEMSRWLGSGCSMFFISPPFFPTTLTPTCLILTDSLISSYFFSVMLFLLSIKLVFPYT